MDYYKINNGKLEKLVGLVSTGSMMKNAIFLTVEEAAAMKAYPSAGNAPESREGYRATGTGYELKDGKWNRVYSYVAITYTMEDYNQALEDHLKEERVTRGYDTREPSQYINSSIARWRQDAQDWIAHVDEVMSYGLSVINTYKETGSAPTLAEFKESLPNIVWTISDSES